MNETLPLLARFVANGGEGLCTDPAADARRLRSGLVLAERQARGALEYQRNGWKRSLFRCGG